MRFKIDKDIFEKYPELCIGLLIAKGIDNSGLNPEVINLMRENEKYIRDNLSKETLSEDPKIYTWRRAYSLFGAKPKKYKCSVENLYRMILDGIELRHINKVVDIYNYISIKHMIPAGGDDISKVEGDIALKLAKGYEKLIELGSMEEKNPKEGEVVYADDNEILCRRWNWRECEKTKMTEGTKDVCLVIEGLFPFAKEDVERILEELRELVEKYCGGEIVTYVLNNEITEVEI